MSAPFFSILLLPFPPGQGPAPAATVHPGDRPRRDLRFPPLWPGAESC